VTTTTEYTEDNPVLDGLEVDLDPHAIPDGTPSAEKSPPKHALPTVAPTDALRPLPSREHPIDRCGRANVRSYSRAGVGQGQVLREEAHMLAERSDGIELAAVEDGRCAIITATRGGPVHDENGTHRSYVSHAHPKLVGEGPTPALPAGSSEKRPGRRFAARCDGRVPVVCVGNAHTQTRLVGRWLMLLSRVPQTSCGASVLAGSRQCRVYHSQLGKSGGLGELRRPRFLEVLRWRFG
jgi:hypothetical protein